MPLFTFDMSMKHALKEAGIFPEIVDESFEQKSLLEIKYGDEDVTLGNKLTTQQTAEAPQVRFVPDEEQGDAFYTLFLVDPDAPLKSDPKNAPWRHWVVGNIPGNQQEQVNVAANQITNYVGPSPPRGTGDHRYVFLLYKQPNNIRFEALSQSVQDRRCFNFKQYAQQYGLELVALNFFYCSASE